MNTRIIVKTIPLILLLLVLFLPIAFFIIDEIVFEIFFVLVLIYFFYRSFLFSTGSFLGFIKYKRENLVNWQERLIADFPNESDLPNHLIAVPVNNESVGIIIRLIDSIRSQRYNQQKVFISISIEQSSYSEKIHNSLKNRFSDLGDRLQIFSHKLSDEEVSGAASNRTNAVKKFLDTEILNQRQIENTIITSPDCDTVFDPQYLSRVTYEYIKNNKNQNYFFQTGVYRVMNNLHSVPVIIKVLSLGLTMSILSTSFWMGSSRYTFSCFSMSLSKLIKIDFWNNKIPIDDTPFHWRAFKLSEGDWQCKTFFISVTVDAIQSNNFLLTLIKQYQQYFRWGWGIIAFPYAISSILSSKQTWLEKLITYLHLFENLILVKIFPLITTYTTYIFLNSSKNNSILEIFLTVISSINLALLIPIISTRALLISPKTKTELLQHIFLQTVELPLGFLNLFAYGFLPYLHAYANFAFNKNVNEQITWAEKGRIDSN